MTATTAHAPRPTKKAIAASLDMQMPTEPEIDDIGPEPEAVAAFFQGIAAESDEGLALAFDDSAKPSPSSENNSQNAQNSHPPTNDKAARDDAECELCESGEFFSDAEESFSDEIEVTI